MGQVREANRKTHGQMPQTAAVVVQVKMDTTLSSMSLLVTCWTRAILDSLCPKKRRTKRRVAKTNNKKQL